MGLVQGISGNAGFLIRPRNLMGRSTFVGVAAMTKVSTSSFPTGYNSPQRSITAPCKAGEIVCRMLGFGGLANTVSATANLTAELHGDGTIGASGTMGRNLQCNIDGSSSVSCTISAIGNLVCEINIGAQPSAFDIAQAVLTAVAANYNQAGTIGEKINASGGGSSGGSTASEIATAVWANPTGQSVDTRLDELTTDIAAIPYPPSVNDVADAVWDKALTTPVAGSVADKLNSLPGLGAIIAVTGD